MEDDTAVVSTVVVSRSDTGGGGAGDASGLTTQQAENLQKTHGFNEVVSIEIPEWRKFLMRYVGVVPFLMLLTAIVSVAIAEVCDEDELLTRDPRCDACTEGMRDWVSFALLIF